MGHVKAESEDEKNDLKDLGQDLMRRNEQLAQVRKIVLTASLDHAVLQVL